MRVGIGYDVHRLSEGRKLILGGVEIPYELGLLGHSDADVLIHAICDAILGAAALGDIGSHFPDTDPKYKGISSLILLSKVQSLVKEMGYSINNIDSIVIAQQPKLAPFIPQMIGKIAQALKIDGYQVSIKATTTEALGVVGEGKGIAAEAVVILSK
jgi:2-C-methyl-D-erythritol 2,4-cyclodiphosphate synthase